MDSTFNTGTTGLLWQDMMNGRAVGNTTAATANEDGTASTKSGMDETKEMFLKLLVAEMQYQDPLEPTDNSEYVKELSQFTQVETLNSVNDQVEQLSANTMVGKYVEITDSETGKYVEGKVDYVQNNNGIMYVSVGGNSYKVADITSVADGNYFENTTMAANIEQMIGLLPDPDKLTLADADKVTDVATAAASLSQEAQDMVSADAKQRLSDIVTKLNEMRERQAEIDAAKEQTAAANSTAAPADGANTSANSAADAEAAADSANTSANSAADAEAAADNASTPADSAAGTEAAADNASTPAASAASAEAASSVEAEAGATGETDATTDDEEIPTTVVE